MSDERRDRTDSEVEFTTGNHGTTTASDAEWFWDSGSWRLHRCPAAGCAGCALCSQTESAEIDISIHAEGADGIHETWVRRFGRDTPIYLMAAFWAADHDVPPETVGCDLLSMPGSPLDMRKTPAELGWTGSRVELSAFPLVTELAD